MTDTTQTAETVEQSARPGGQLAAALAEVQKNLPKIRKGEVGRVSGKTKDGDPYSYEYKYADLADITDAIMPILGEHGLAFTASPTFIEGGMLVLICELLHVSGESRTATWPLPQQGKPQDLGSAITYGRRYTLCAMTGVAPEEDDDDGAAAQRAYERAEQRQQRQPTEKEQATAQLRAVVAEKRLNESLVPQEFQAKMGVSIFNASAEQVREYTAFVQQTGRLGEDPWQVGSPTAGEESQDPDQNAQRDTQSAREETAGMPSQQEQGS